MATGSINGGIGLGGEAGQILTVLTEGDLTTSTMTGRTGAAGAGLTGNFGHTGGFSGNLNGFSESGPNGTTTGANFNFLFVMP